MKYFSTLLLFLIIATSSVQAEHFFQNTNPFPQTEPQSMNNIYESDPSVMHQEEQKKAKKSWFKRKQKDIKQDNSSNYVVPESKIINEGSSDGSFYVFK